MKMSNKNSQKIYDITYNQKYLFLNCPKCSDIPYISFNKQHPEKINIKCDKCHNSSEMTLNNYLTQLKSDDLLKDKKCVNHDIFLDKFCYKCHIQFCSKCEANNQHSTHKVKTIKKKITHENLEKGGQIIEHYKNYFKKYISEFMNKYINKFPKNKHYFITNNLLKPYINDMKNFLHFYDCVLMNYDIDYPNYYQQYNLRNFLNYLNDKTTLLDLNERKLERIFKYTNNNFLINKKNDGNNLIKYDPLNLSSNLFNQKILKTLLIDEELILLYFNDSIKLYNYKNKTIISALDINVNICDLYKNLKICPIYKDIFAIILPISYKSTIIKICSIYAKNLILFEKKFDYNIKIIKKINDNSFGIILPHKIEIYKASDTYENISNMLKNEKLCTPKFESIGIIKISDLYDFIQVLSKEYIIGLCKGKIIVAKSIDFSIYKEIKINEEYKHITQIDEYNFILGGRIIGIFNIKEWSYSIIYNDNIPKLKVSYLTGTDNTLEYSYFVLTYFNKLICRRKFISIFKCHYEDVDDEILSDDKALCIFDFNPEKNSLSNISIDRTFKIKNIDINSYGEIIISNENNIIICNSD